MLAEQNQRIRGKRNKSVFGPLSSVDVDQHSILVNIGDLKKECLLKAKTAGIDGCQKCFVVRCSDMAKNSVDFLAAQHTRQTLFFLSFQHLEQMPVAPEDIDEEKLEGAVADFKGTRRPFGDIAPKQKILLKFLFGNVTRIFIKMLDEHPDGPGIAFLSTPAHSGQLKGLNSLVVPRGFQ